MWIFRPKCVNNRLTGNYEVGYLKMNSSHSVDFVVVYICTSLELAEQKVHYLNGGN